MSEASAKRGPNTEEGKRKVSLNALKHGLHAKSPQARQAIEAEAEVSYEKALDMARTTYWPADQIEDALVKRMAVCMARLSKMEAMEHRISERYPDRSRPASSLEAVLKSERLISLEFHRCIRSLSAKKKAEFEKSQKTISSHEEAERETVPQKPWNFLSEQFADNRG